MKPFLMWFVIAVILVFAVVVLDALYLRQSQKSELNQNVGVNPNINGLPWQTFTSDPNRVYGGLNFKNIGFTFAYPPGWTIRNTNPLAILDLYDASVTADIAECDLRRADAALSSQNQPTPFYSECSGLNPSIDLFPSQYATLDASDKADYQNYQPLNLPGIDAFTYHDNTTVTVYYHVNFPDGKTAIEFAYDNDDRTPADYPAMLPSIISSIRFTTSKKP